MGDPAQSGSCSRAHRLSDSSLINSGFELVNFYNTFLHGAFAILVLTILSVTIEISK